MYTVTARLAGVVDCLSADGWPRPPNECPGYDTKQSDGEVPAMLELWEMRSTPSLASLSCQLWPGMVAPDRVLSMGQIELHCLKLATIVEGDPKAPFSIATTPRCRGGRYSIPWIAPLYPWTVPYNAEC